MSSTTIRYSGVPENSHSRRFDSGHNSGQSPEPASDITADSTSYTHRAPTDDFDRGPDSDLTLKWRRRLRAMSDPDPAASGADRPEVPGTRGFNRAEGLSIPGLDRTEGPATSEIDQTRDPATGGLDLSEGHASHGFDHAEDPATHGFDHTAEPATISFVPGFTRGKAAPVSDDPRHNHAFPHPQNPGLFTEPDGFYDWANRRLFLPDGSPDPMTPGAYRYQTRPDLCDLNAPDSNPSNPRYEPMHLRHKPGDTYLIDRARPFDVLDPGPFGSPGWFPDRRTGRHRRDELPDPIPWWEVEEEPDKAEWAEHAEALWERRTRITREREALEAAERASFEPKSPDRHATEQVSTGQVSTGQTSTEHRTYEPEAAESAYIAAQQPGSRRPEGSPDDNDPPEPPSRQSGQEDRPNRQPEPRPQARPQPWSRPEPEARQPSPGRSRGPSQPPHPEQPMHLPRQMDRRSTDVPEEPPHRFNKLREDAWDRFIEKSADLAAAHRSQTAIERECGPTIGRIARGIRLIAGLLRHRPRPREAAPVPPDRHTALADRTARFAQAMRGVQRARNETSPPNVRPDYLPRGAAWA
ncbi:hypothetical protein [Glycomyces rhizosphaerae]|uniref:Uncharacterized protein n=1 Tax=Glycomyces rhizosphaerae TaxID=2054422 RepID=A0ABV7PXP3_9ACTN